MTWEYDQWPIRFCYGLSNSCNCNFHLCGHPPGILLLFWHKKKQNSLKRKPQDNIGTVTVSSWHRELTQIEFYSRSCHCDFFFFFLLFDYPLTYARVLLFHYLPISIAGQFDRIIHTDVVFTNQANRWLGLIRLQWCYCTDLCVNWRQILFDLAITIRADNYANMKYKFCYCT